MSKKRDVKDLEFLSEDNSTETKDINDKLFSDKNQENVANEVKNTENQEENDSNLMEEDYLSPNEEKVVEEEINDDKVKVDNAAVFGEDISKNKEKPNNSNKNAFSTQEKNNKKKWIKISIVALVVLLIIAGIVLGALGIAGVFKKDGPSEINGGYSMDEVGSWVENQDNKDTKVNDAINVLTDRATIYYYDVLGENNYLFDKNQAQAIDYKDNVERQAKRRVENERSNYKDQEGKNWEEAWDKNLVSLGFSTAANGGEQQYIDSIVSDDLKSELEKTLTSGSSLYESVYLTADPSSYQFASSEEVYSGLYAVLPNGSEVDTAFNGRHYFDTEALFNFYLEFSKPISFNEIFIPLTTTTYEKDHGFSGTGETSKVNFASTTDLEKFYYLISDLNSGQLDFKANDVTNSGIISLNDFVINSTTDGGGDTTGETGTTTYDETTDGGDGSTENADGEVAIIDGLFNSRNITKGNIDSIDFSSLSGAISLNGSDALTLEEIQNLDTAQLSTVGKNVYDDLGSFFETTNLISYKLSNTSDSGDSFVIYSLQSDGMHFYEFAGTIGVTGTVDSTAIKTVGTNIISEDLTNSYKNLNGFDKRIYGIYDSFSTWISDNIDLLLLNIAYENDAPLIQNDDYDWSNDIESELGSDWLVQIEKAIYGDPAISSFINFQNIVKTYNDFNDKYYGLFTLAEFAPGGTDYDTLRQSTTYYESSLTYNSSDALESWNYFMANYTAGSGYDVAYGAISTGISLTITRKSSRGDK